MIIPLMEEADETFVSGAVVTNKLWNLAGFLMTCHLNTRSIRDKITYQKFYGDKESYWFANVLMSTPYHFVPQYSGDIGPIRYTPLERAGTKTYVLSSYCILLNPPLFNHWLVEYKGAGDDRFLGAEGWVPQGGNRQYCGEDQKPPHLFCVAMPKGGAGRGGLIELERR